MEGKGMGGKKKMVSGVLVFEETITHTVCH